MKDWTFFTNHTLALVCIAHEPGVRLRDIATTLNITERSAFGIISELAAAGYVVKDKDGRRNRYQIQSDAPVKMPIGRSPTMGEMLEILVDGELTARTGVLT